jgi:hypothetical protein
MAMGPMPEGQAQEGAEAPGGASQLVADTHSNLLKLQELVGAKFPEEAEALGGIIQAYQSFIDGMGQSPGAEKQGPPMPGTSTPEVGAANVKPAL